MSSLLGVSLGRVAETAIALVKFMAHGGRRWRVAQSNAQLQQSAGVIGMLCSIFACVCGRLLRACRRVTPVDVLLRAPPATTGVGTWSLVLVLLRLLLLLIVLQAFVLL